MKLCYHSIIKLVVIYLTLHKYRFNSTVLGDVGMQAQYGQNPEEYVMQESYDEKYVTCVKILGYRTHPRNQDEGSSSNSSLTRDLPMDWNAYPAISLTITELKGFLTDIIPKIDQQLASIRVSHRHPTEKVTLGCR